MTTDLDQAIRTVVSDIVAAAPDVAENPSSQGLGSSFPSDASRRMTVTVAAASIAAVGVVGVVLVNYSSERHGGPPNAHELAAADLGTALAAPPATQPSRTTIGRIDSCDNGEGETAVPNVGGMTVSDATDALISVGLNASVVSEVVSAEQQPATGSGLRIAWQEPTPGESLDCGELVEITATTQPVYIVQTGDTWESIAVSQGLTVDELLALNDLDAGRLGELGGSPTSPLETGRVVRLSLPHRANGTAPPTTS